MTAVPLVLVGSPAFLRLWAALGCREIALTSEMTYEELRELGQEPASIVLYEDGLLDQLSAVQREELWAAEPPCWIPLPSPRKEPRP